MNIEYIPQSDIYGHSQREAALRHEASWSQINALLDSYEQTFRPMTERLYSELQSPDADYTNQILGIGNRSIVFRTNHEGREYAVRTPKNKADRDSIIYHHVCGAVRCQGAPHLEQIIAASIEDGVTVAEILPGTPMDKNMTIDDVLSITEDQLIELTNTLYLASKSGLELDLSNPSNVLYDREVGFGIVDYYCTDSKVACVTQPVSVTASLMADIIMSAGIHGRERSALHPASFEMDAIQLLANQEVLKIYRHVAASYLETPDAIRVLDEIDMVNEEYTHIITQYQDPIWRRDQTLANTALRLAVSA